jgi:hypothetical protein
MVDKYLRVFIIMAFVLTMSCTTKENDLGHALLEAETIDDAIVVAKKCERLEAKSLPIFVKTLDALSREKHRLNNYGKISVCLKSLHNLAEKGIYSRDEAVFLLLFIQGQEFITDTLVTAEILKTITGTDVGYDKEFVEKYTQNNESKRKQMIRGWEKAIEKKWKQGQNKRTTYFSKRGNSKFIQWSIYELLC